MTNTESRSSPPKSLGDYPVDEWIEAAGGCDGCPARYQVRVLSLAARGQVGVLRTRIEHADCWVGEGVCEEDEYTGWTFEGTTVEFAGRQYAAFASSTNIVPCLNCWKLICDMPLILFPGSGAYQLHFCMPCVKELNLFASMKR
jgi:hypothetical protein